MMSQKFKKIFFRIYMNLILKNCMFFPLLILGLFFSSLCFAQKTSSERNKNIYLKSQSMQFGKNPVQGVFFSTDDQHAIVLTASSSLEIIRIENGKRVRIIPPFKLK